MKKFFTFIGWFLGFCGGLVALGIVSKVASFFFKLGWQLASTGLSK